MPVDVLAAPQVGLVKSAGRVTVTSMVVLTAPLKTTPSCSKGRNMFRVGVEPAG